MALQGGVVDGRGTAHRQPAIRMAIQERLSQRRVLSAEQPMDQRAGRPVLAGGVQPVQGGGQQRQQFVPSVFELRQQAATLARGAAQEAL
jgi:hypothetical protein